MEFWNKRKRLSIRKLNNGIASVLIGIALVGVLGTNTVKAETPATGTEATSGTEKTGTPESGTTPAAAEQATRQATINYVVVYKDASGKELYRVQRTTTTETTEQSSTSATIPVNATDMTSASELANYELAESDSKEATVIEGANTEVTFTVKPKQSQVAIKYFVVYKDGDGKEIYRREEAQTVENVPAGTTASAKVTVDATDMVSVADLSSYRLEGETSQQAEVTDGGANEIVFKVSRRTRKVLIKYSVVYKNENGDAVYREDKEKEVETTDEVATATVEEAPVDVETTTALNGYKLLEPVANQKMLITEGATNEITFNVEDATSADTGTEGTDITAVEFYSNDEFLGTQYVRIGETLREPSLPSSGEDVFLGWYIKGEDTKVDFTAPTSFKKDTTVGGDNKELVRIVARYNNSRRVVFKDDEGVIVRVKEVQAGKTVTDKDVVFLSPKNSTVFSHWSTTANGAQAYDFSTPVTNDLELHVVVKNQKIINFDSMGGTEVDNMYVDNGSLASNSPGGKLPTPERKGYDFVQWLDKSTNKAVDINAEVTRNYNLKAQWQPRTDTPYKVVHLVETPSGKRTFAGINYTVSSVVELTGTTDAIIASTMPSALAAEYVLSSNQEPSVRINGDGESVLNVYYERKKTQLTVIYANRNLQGYIILKEGYIDYITKVYSVKWNKELTDYLSVPNVVSWYNETRDLYYTRPNLPKRNFDETIKEDVFRRITATPTIYFVDIDTKERFDYYKVKGRTGETYYYTPKEGYEFVKFQNEDEGVGSTTFTNADITIYFRKKHYDVKFVSNDANRTDKTKNLAYLDSVSPVVPSDYKQYVTKKTDVSGVTYLFKGWYDTENGSGDPVDFSNIKMPAGGLVYYGIWKKEFIPVIVHNETVLDTSFSNDKYVLLVDPGKTITDKGAVFYGVLDSDGSVKVDLNGTPIVDTSRTFDGTLTVNNKLNYDGTILQPEWYRLINGRLESVNPSTLQISEHGTIYVPVWNYPTKTLKYNANGGANPPTTSDLKFKENIAIADPGAMTPPKEGFVFVSWNTKADGKGTRYLPKDKLQFNDFAGSSLELFAEWVTDPTNDKVTVTFDPNGGNGRVINTEYRKNQAFYVRNQGYNRPGYNLIGWTTNQTSTTSQYKTGQKLSADHMTLYALWAEKLSAKVETSNVFIDKAKVDSDKVVVTPNYTEAKLTSSAIYGLSVDANGVIVGTPKVPNWYGVTDETRDVKIPVRVSLSVSRPTGNSTSEVFTVYVPVTIQRDTDGDGDPDVTDPDDDNDGIPDGEDSTQKVFTKLTATGKTITSMEGVAVPATQAVTINKKPSDVTSVTWPTGLTGLDIDSTGQLTGTPVVADWGTLETKSFVVPVEVAFNNPETGLIETAKTNVTIIVDRDTDRDGIPDKTDSDDDNDGIPDRQDSTSKVFTDLTATGKTKTVTEKARIASEKVVDSNKPYTKVVQGTLPTGLTGVSINDLGYISGAAVVTDWANDNETSRTFSIPVTVESYNALGNRVTTPAGILESVDTVVVLTVQRDTDGDGDPDVTDPDDDNDGIKDEDDKNPKTPDTNLPVITAVDATVTEKAAISPIPVTVTDEDDDTIAIDPNDVTGLPEGLVYNPATEAIEGTPTVSDWGTTEESRDFPVEIKATDGAGNEATKTITITVQRDTDGDGDPDVTDP
ncbi:InlB B-repeat-containing protein, partial [Streptococcus parasuis]|uniref:InlB B-repeat-containing protein n=1 Tax=Streptococcus parasuis TaxID=1501662 RepID=UPI0028AF8D4F